MDIKEMTDFGLKPPSETDGGDSDVTPHALGKGAPKE